MKIALYITKDTNYIELAITIKKTILAIDPETILIEIEDRHLSADNWLETSILLPKDNIKCIIAVGDTGTFLRAIFHVRSKIPVLAASTEKISFFTEITPNNLYEALQAILTGKYFIDQYNRIEIKDPRSDITFSALNEIAIFPNESARLMNYTLVIDDDVLYRSCRADGLIISTALGSTGYALSSGGPIAYGDPEILIVVPVNPLDKDHSPVVVPINSVIKIINVEARSPLGLILDGQLRIPIEEEVSIRKSNISVGIVRFESKRNLVARLRKRLVEQDLRLLEGVPPSAKYIFKLLLTEGEMTQKELIESTGLPNRTVRNALRIMKEKGIIMQRAYLKDARQSIYFVS